MPNRMISLERNTNETQIDLTLDLDGTGRYEVDTGCGFLNHMLELFARHGRFDLVLTCHGDVQVDYHHTTEDVGIALGQAFARALGDMRGIQRYGSFYLPMDEALILCAVDLSGRCTLNWDIHCSTEKVGDFDVECAKEFWLGFARSVPVPPSPAPAWTTTARSSSAPTCTRPLKPATSLHRNIWKCAWRTPSAC